MIAPRITTLEDIRSELLTFREQYRLFLLVDENTNKYCLPLIGTDAFEYVHEVPAGEGSKSHDTLLRIYSALKQHTFGRGDMIVNLGGGVVTDLGGFAAGTYMRGIPFVHIPTSLLAMVDAAHGGKVGINFEGVKNYIGLFTEAQQCLIAPEFLQTLPAAELRCGFAEMLKHALLQGGEMYYELFESERPNWSENINIASIHRSFLFKHQIVERDFRESGLRKVLNFGHTIGHALESVMADAGEHIGHGDAIAVGLYCSTRLSESHTDLNPSKAAHIRSILSGIYVKVELDPERIGLITHRCHTDKKNNADHILMVLLRKVGEPVYDVPVSESNISRALEYYSDNYGN